MFTFFFFFFFFFNLFAKTYATVRQSKIKFRTNHINMNQMIFLNIYPWPFKTQPLRTNFYQTSSLHSLLFTAQVCVVWKDLQAPAHQPEDVKFVCYSNKNKKLSRVIGQHTNTKIIYENLVNR